MCQNLCPIFTGQYDVNKNVCIAFGADFGRLHRKPTFGKGLYSLKIKTWIAFPI